METKKIKYQCLHPATYDGDWDGGNRLWCYDCEHWYSTEGHSNYYKHLQQDRLMYFNNHVINNMSTKENELLSECIALNSNHYYIFTKNVSEHYKKLRNVSGAGAAYTLFIEQYWKIENDQVLLHREDGPAYKKIYRVADRWGQPTNDTATACKYYLNDIEVPDWLALTPVEQLDMQRYTSLKNISIMREFIKKIGIDRFCYKFSRGSIDKQENYELHKFTLFPEYSKLESTYLKMMNPSCSEVWHVEGVPNDINTVQEALNFRNGFSQDQIDDEYGADWYQQGDVLIKPKNATKFKSQPIILT